MPSRSIRHKNNHSTTTRGSHLARCRHGRCDTKTMTWRPHRGSHSARCRCSRYDKKTMTWRLHQGSHSARCLHGRLEQRKRLDDPLEVHIWRAAVTVDATQNNDLATPSRFTIGHLYHNGRSGTNTTTRRPHRGSQSAMCAITVDAAQNNDRRPHQVTIVTVAARRLATPMFTMCHHGRCGTKNNDSTTPSRFTIGSFVSQRSMRHKNNDLTTPWRFIFGALPSRSIRHKNNHSTTTRGSHLARCRHG